MSQSSIDREDTPKPGTAPPPDARDAALARLERALAEERQNAGALRDSIEQMTFKLAILEKGYTKQLADTRDAKVAAERALADIKARIAALGTGGEDTVRLLAEARAALDRVTAERDQLRREHARSGGNAPAFRAARPAADRPPEDQGTINQLMSSSSWVQKARGAGEIPASPASARTAEEPHGEMIAPELVFTERD